MSLGTWQSIQWHYGSAETRKKIRSLWRKVTQGECNTNRKTEYRKRVKTVKQNGSNGPDVFDSFFIALLSV